VSTSAVQVARLLALIPYLRQHPGISLSKVAAEFGISSQQVRRDLEVAYFCGLPGGMPGDLIEVDMDAVEGEGIVNLSNADVLSRPLRFTPDEAVALVLALQAIRAVAAPSSHAAVDGVLATLRSLAGDATGQAVMTVTAGTPEVNATVAGAVDQGRRLRLTYDGLSRGETTYPVVDPVHVELRDGSAYLEGWALDRSGWRTYRMDRIAAAEPTGEPAGRHGTPPRRAWLDPGSGAATEVTLWVSPRAAWVASTTLRAHAPWPTAAMWCCSWPTRPGCGGSCCAPRADAAWWRPSPPRRPSSPRERRLAAYEDAGPGPEG
jgi:proteasome accessory factor C